MRVKICGITRPEQGVAIARLGADALGLVCVPASPRYVTPVQIRAVSDRLLAQLPASAVPDRVGLFADTTLAEIQQTVGAGELNWVQLHGSESPAFCDAVRQALPGLSLIKALRIRSAEDLVQAAAYVTHVDALLLDAYDPLRLGGTGHTLDWTSLRSFRPACAWFLAGGLNPENLAQALGQLAPDGIDLSSGVERAPGDKDLERVADLFRVLRQLRRPQVSPS